MDLSSEVVSQDYSQPSFAPSYAQNVQATDLGNFLGRLVKLGSFTWDTGTVDSTLFEVYDTWRNNVTVASKLSGYKFFRAKPVLHFVVNGFSWYYGKLLIAADLFPGFDGGVSRTVDQLEQTINGIGDRAAAYQAPHVTIDPSQSATYKLELPFYSANEWYELTTEDKQLVPEIWLKIFPFNTLASANEQPVGSVSISVYVEMTYLELSVPSWPLFQEATILPALVEQGKHSHSSHKKPHDHSDVGPTVTPPKESHKDGILSGPLTSLLNVTKTVHDMGGEAIPVVGPFLGPFNAIGDKAADALRIFGFASPINLDTERVYAIGNSMNFAGNARDNSVRLTNDVKNNLAIDAAAASIGENDDMQVSSIISRPGLLQQFSWTNQGLGAPNSFGTVVVNPMNSFATGVASGVRMTPLAHVTSLHEYWSGSIVYTIEIVASQFHRGTVGVSYIPYRTIPNSFNFDELPNQFQTVIMDITETKSIEFIVPYVDVQPVLPVTQGFGTEYFTQNNGRLIIYEINPLKSASTSNNVGVNVYCRAGDDYALYRPTLANWKDGYALAASPQLPIWAPEPPDPVSTAMLNRHRRRETYFEVALKEQAIHDETHKEEDDTHDIPNKTAQTNHSGRSLLYFGEQTLTIKTLMSKPMLHAIVDLPTAQNFYSYRLPRYPYNGGATVISNGTISFTGILMIAFLSFRGGMRYKVINFMGSPSPDAPANDSSGGFNSTFHFCTYTENTTNDYVAQSSNDNLAATLAFSSGQSFHRAVNNMTEIELPYTNTHRFYNARKVHTKTNPHQSMRTAPTVCGRTNFNSDDDPKDMVFACCADDASLHGYFIAPLVTY